VISGTWIVYPWYREEIPESPKSLLLADPDTADWHEFAMEWKEHVAWLAPMFATAAAFIVYALAFGRQDWLILIDQLYLTTEGIFGIPAGVSATYVILFIIFGALVERTGTGRLFMDFALALTRCACTVSLRSRLGASTTTPNWRQSRPERPRSLKKHSQLAQRC
jgi:hypothetical protein